MQGLNPAFNSNSTSDTFLFKSGGSTVELVNIGGNQYRAKIEGAFNQAFLNLRAPWNAAGQYADIVVAHSASTDVYTRIRTITSATDWGGDLAFFTNPGPLNTTAALERVRILANGNMGIGISNPIYKLQLNGQPAANGYTAWTNYSDARLKENITDLITDGSSAMAKIKQLHPVSFNYNVLTGYDVETRARRISGFIAQEIQPVFPEMVGEVKINGKTYFDTNLSNLSLYLVEAIKEIAEALDNLAAKIDDLFIKISGHDEKIQALEKANLEQQEQIDELKRQMEELKK